MLGLNNDVKPVASTILLADSIAACAILPSAAIRNHPPTTQPWRDFLAWPVRARPLITARPTSDRVRFFQALALFHRRRSILLRS
jgi:hypothetical protein